MLDLQPTDNYTNNYRLQLLKAIKSLLANERELKRLLVNARENIRNMYGLAAVKDRASSRLELEIIRLATNQRYTKDMLNNTDTLLGHKFRNTVYRIEDEYDRKMQAMEDSRKLMSK